MKHSRHLAFVTASLVLMLALFTGCQRLSPKAELDSVLDARNRPQQLRLRQQERRRALHSEVQRRFALVRDLIRAKSFNKADAILASMSSLTEYHDEIEDLKRLVFLARTMGVNETALAIDQQRMVNEAQDALLLPKTYNTSVDITPDIQPEFLPDGYLEQLLSKRVSMKIENLPLANLAMQLQDVDELNLADPLNIIFSDETVKGKTFSCNFKDVPLYEVFSYISRNLGVAFNITDSLIWVTAAQPGNGLKLETRIFHLRHGIVPKVPEGIAAASGGKTAFTSGSEEDTDLKTALTEFYKTVTTGGSFTLFENRNILLVKDTRENIRTIEKLVQELDRPPLQVIVEAKFITISQNDLRDVGIELSKANGGHSGATISTDNNGHHPTNANVADFFTQLGTIVKDNAEGVGALKVGGILFNRSYDLVISAIENKTSTVALSAPRIAVLNNRTGRIRKGDNVYYFKEYGVQSVDSGDKGTTQLLVPKGQPTELPLGITFDVKVSIGHDYQTILLGLRPEIVTLVKWEDYISSNAETIDKVTTNYITNVKLPHTNEQSTATSAVVHSGDTLIMGGMIENTKSKVVKKIPLLGDIPWLGGLFRHTEERDTPTNLLIFVTATILNERGEAVIYTPEPEINAADLVPLTDIEDDTDASLEKNFQEGELSTTEQPAPAEQPAPPPAE
ncbi:MAG: hypothetical protein IKR13_05385 [Victivallales bacterium]|nr:hypothetical protein [Victivallales bacterium]